MFDIEVIEAPVNTFLINWRVSILGLDVAPSLSVAVT